MFENNRAFLNGESYHGFSIVSSSHFNTLNDNWAYNNTNDGFYITSNNITVKNNMAFNNTNGFMYLSGFNGTFSGNSAINNTQDGFVLNWGDTAL